MLVTCVALGRPLRGARRETARSAEVGLRSADGCATLLVSYSSFNYTCARRLCSQPARRGCYLCPMRLPPAAPDPRRRPAPHPGGYPVPFPGRSRGIPQLHRVQRRRHDDVLLNILLFARWARPSRCACGASALLLIAALLSPSSSWRSSTSRRTRASRPVVQHAGWCARSVLTRTAPLAAAVSGACGATVPHGWLSPRRWCVGSRARCSLPPSPMRSTTASGPQPRASRAVPRPVLAARCPGCDRAGPIPDSGWCASGSLRSRDSRCTSEPSRAAYARAGALFAIYDHDDARCLTRS